MKADTIRYYEIRPRRDKRGFDLISGVLPFGRLWYHDTDAASDTRNFTADHSEANCA